MNINRFNGLNAKLRYDSLCLNEIRTNPQDADWRCAATPKGCAPGMAHIKNLAANLGRSPLTHSQGYGPAGDRPRLFARFPLSFVPFMQYAG
jgi:hypothetical protein